MGKNIQFEDLTKKDKVLTKITQSIIANEVAYNFNHDIKFTPYYKHQLKKYFRLLETELIKAQKTEFDVMFDKEEGITDEVHEKMAEMIREISSVGLFDFENITNIVRAYKSSPNSINGIVNKILK